MPSSPLRAAEAFLAAHARILDRRRYERLFRDGAAAPVRDAVAAHANADGGLGHALEPDGRAPGSQPAAVELGLRTLHECDAWDARLAAAACDWLGRTEPVEGGATFVDPGIEGWPHAPWWQPEPGLPASLVSTGQIAGTLHARGTSHPWLERATALMWARIDALAEPGAYEMRGVLRFLEHVGDRARAQAAFERVGAVLVGGGLVTLEPGAAGEVHTPLDFAPNPDSIARRLFDEATIEVHLDHLAGSQADDGGWTFNWPAWSPVAAGEWRGSRTVDALRTLRANGRI
jgi:hypothetical protein